MSNAGSIARKVLTIVMLAAMQTSCIAWYQVKPETAWDLPPARGDRAETVYYHLEQVYGWQLGEGPLGVYAGFEEAAVFARSVQVTEMPSRGLAIKVHSHAREASLPYLIWGYLGYSYGFLLPTYIKDRGHDIVYDIYRDSVKVASYEYQVYQRLFVWAPAFLVWWLNAATSTEDEAFLAVTRQFFHDALRDGAFDATAPPPEPEPEAPESPVFTGCGKDTDCKGERICVQQQCADPPPRVEPVPPEPTATEPTPAEPTPIEPTPIEPAPQS